MQMSKSVLLRLNIERILFDQVLRMRPDLCQPAYITNNIEKKVDLERMQRLTGKFVSASSIRNIVE